MECEVVTVLRCDQTCKWSLTLDIFFDSKNVCNWDLCPKRSTQIVFFKDLYKSDCLTEKDLRTSQRFLKCENHCVYSLSNLFGRGTAGKLT